MKIYIFIVCLLCIIGVWIYKVPYHILLMRRKQKNDKKFLIPEGADSDHQVLMEATEAFVDKELPIEKAEESETGYQLLQNAYAQDEDFRGEIDSSIIQSQGESINVSEADACNETIKMQSIDPSEQESLLEAFTPYDISWCLENIRHHKKMDEEEKLRCGAIIHHIDNTEYKEQYFYSADENEKNTAEELRKAWIRRLTESEE